MASETIVMPEIHDAEPLVFADQTNGGDYTEVYRANAPEQIGFFGQEKIPVPDPQKG